MTTMLAAEKRRCGNCGWWNSSRARGEDRRIFKNRAGECEYVVVFPASHHSKGWKTSMSKDCGEGCVVWKLRLEPLARKGNK